MNCPSSLATDATSAPAASIWAVKESRSSRGPAALPAEPLPIQTTTSDTSVIQYTNFEGIDKEFTIITGIIDDKGDYVRVRVSPTFKYITLKRTRIGNPEALFESTSPAAAPAGETAQVTPEPVETGEPVSQATTGTVNMVITSCGLATYDATAILRDLRAGSDAFDLHGLLKDFPKTVAENVSAEKANEFKKRFEDAGCTVELHPWTGPNIMNHQGPFRISRTLTHHDTNMRQVSPYHPRY